MLVGIKEKNKNSGPQVALACSWKVSPFSKPEELLQLREKSVTNLLGTAFVHEDLGAFPGKLPD